MLFFNNNKRQESVEERPVDGKSVPLKYKGYEELLNIDHNYHDDIKLPKDIHGNVRALQYTLDHPLIFTDQSTKPRARMEKKDTVNTSHFVLCTILQLFHKKIYSAINPESIRESRTLRHVR